MKVGPIPGDIDEATFFAFYYEARDVLCLGTLSNWASGKFILIGWLMELAYFENAEKKLLKLKIRKILKKRKDLYRIIFLGDGM